MHLVSRGNRALVDLWLALLIAAFLLALSAAINFAPRIERFGAEYSSLPIARLLINLLFAWLAVLLAVAFTRWRTAALRRAAMEDIISSISPDTLIVVTPARDIVTCNASVLRMFGYAEGEVLGRKTDLLYCDRRTSPGRPREIYEALERDGFHVGQAQGQRKDGTTFPLEIISAELSGRTGAVLLLRDTSERTHAERQRQELEDHIQRQRKMESLGLLAGGVAHDFRNVLTVIQGNAEILGHRLPADGAARHHVEAILEASQRAATLCRQMLAYAGKGEFVRQALNLSDTVGKTCSLLESTLHPRAKLECSLGGGLPSFEGDAVQIQQLIMNLVINAAESLEGKDGTVAVRTAVRLCDADFLRQGMFDQQLAPGRYLCCEVSDTGCGMDEATLARAFDPFFSTKAAGRGLGLASALGIVRGHGGMLHVATAPGRGTTFTVILPNGSAAPAAR